jgi:hypothetical protein
MANKIKLITLLNGKHVVESNEIEMIREDFYMNTTRPYYHVLLKLIGEENFDNNRLFKVWGSKAEIENRILQIEQRNVFFKNQ